MSAIGSLPAWSLSGWIADVQSSRYYSAMAGRWTQETRARLLDELGGVKWEAIGHFLGEGDYLAFNQGNFEDAIREYEKAWELLETPWQQKVGGSDMLEGMAEFALLSEDKGLANRVLETIKPRMEIVDDPDLRSVCEKLSRAIDSQC